MKVAFCKHNIGEAEIASVVSVLRSPTLTGRPSHAPVRRAVRRVFGLPTRGGRHQLDHGRVPMSAGTGNRPR